MLNEHYHSTHGAFTESIHVFIRSGLHAVWDQFDEIRILEVGFGTGLNAWLTALEANRYKRHIYYTSLERYPLSHQIIQTLQFPQLEDEEQGRKIWDKIHSSKWNQSEKISDWFELQKLEQDWIHDPLSDKYNVIYYDAFAPNKQPEMWTQPLLEKAYRLLTLGGVLVTYTAKGTIKRGLQAAGFQVEKIPGPPGKREMLRARKV